MAIPETILNSVGTWRGTSTLNLPWPPGQEKVEDSESTLIIATDPHQKYAHLAYDWAEDGTAQYGHAIIAGSSDSGKVQMAWTDSWHLSSDVMRLVGTGMSGAVNVLGEYEVEGYPAWGWRFTFEQEGENLTMKMFNISPEGEEVWAVSATYERVSE